MAPPLYQREWLWKGITRPQYPQIFVPTVRLDPTQVIDRRHPKGSVTRNLGFHFTVPWPKPTNSSIDVIRNRRFNVMDLMK